MSSENILTKPFLVFHLEIQGKNIFLEMAVSCSVRRIRYCFFIYLLVIYAATYVDNAKCVFLKNAKQSLVYNDKRGNQSHFVPLDVK